MNNYLSLEESTRKQYLEGKAAKGEITDAERQELKQINETDKSRDEALALACSGGSVTACNEQQKLAHKALDTYKGEAEYQTQYDLREKFPEQMAKYGDLIGDYSREIIGLVDQGYTPEQAKSYIDQRIANDKAYADKYQKALDEIPGWAKIAMTVQDTAGIVYGAKAAGQTINKMEFDRLKIDPHTGKVKVGETQSAVDFQNSMAGQLVRVDGKTSTADFVFISGPNKGKTVDFMFTTTTGSTKEIEGMNKFFNKNWDNNINQLHLHLNKADIIPLDFRKLNPENQQRLGDYINTLSRAEQSKIIIMR